MPRSKATKLLIEWARDKGKLAELRDQLNTSVVVPKEHKFYRDALILKRNGGAVKKAAGGALRAAARAIERTKPANVGADEVTRLKRMVINARNYERAMAEANKPYDATRAAMLGRALKDGVFAADKNFPERSVNLLKLADPAAPSSVARGALSFRDPGYFSGARGVPENAVYVDDLGALRTKGVPVGQALLHRLQEETNGLPLVLESLNDPRTLQWYAERGFRELPKDDLGKNPFGSRLPAMILPAGVKLKAAGGAVKMAGGGIVKTDKQVASDLREGALSGLRRFFNAIPQAVRDWPQQTWDMIRMPADLVLGSPDENRIAREYAPDELKPLPADTARNPHRPGSPESKAYETMAWANPLQAAVFAPAQTARMVASPVGQATLGGLAALMLPGVNMPSAFATGNVIKPVGGQWLGTGEGGNLRRMLEGLKEVPLADTGLAWTRVELPTGGVRWEGRGVGGVLENVMESTNPRFHPLELDESESALNRWIDGPLRKYVLNRMASPEDEIRKLAEVGPIHFEPDGWPGIRAKIRRANAGFDKAGMGRSDLARLWENAADSNISNTHTAKQWADPTQWLDGENYESAISQDPWVKKLAEVSPDERLYALDSPGSRYDLGFDHLIDELHNALRADSDLPANLRLRSENLNKLSMEQAVKRVAEINAWREAQKVAANQELANRAAVVREYTENNPKGLRWVELKATPNAEVTDDALRKAMQERDMLPDEIEAALKDPQQRSEISKMFADEDSLRQQLKYEGDTMGHCVGGYCDDVLEGRTRIFSLRDAKGEPHVTVEVAPEPLKFQGLSGEELEALEPGIWKKIKSERGFNDLFGWLKKNRPDLMEKISVPRIVQIKGKGNKKPNDEYLSFVQDFVRNSPLGGAWSDVGDLQNTELLSVADLMRGRVPKGMSDWVVKNKIDDTSLETYEKFRAAAQKPESQFITLDEWMRHLGYKFSSGGSVPSWRNAYRAALEAA